MIDQFIFLSGLMHFEDFIILLFLDERKKFTVQLVKKYVWLQEEMEKELALKVAKNVLLPRYVEELEKKKNKSSLIGCFVKQV